MAVSALQREPRVVRQSGTVKISGSDWQTKNISFPTAYTQTPLVSVYQEADGKATNLYLPLVSMVTTTGFRLSYYNIPQERTFGWQAIGVV